MQAKPDTHLAYGIEIVNPTDRDWTKHRYILAFGAYGWTRLMVGANSLGDAIDESIDWIVDHAPGLLCDEQVTEAYQEAIRAGMSEEKAAEEAAVDTICGGNEGHYILAWECNLIVEDPTRAEVLALLERKR